MALVKLNFINRSEDSKNRNIVIFQKNLVEDYDTDTIAWKVIKNCSQSDSRPFTCSTDFQVTASDSWGNCTPHLLAENGQKYQVTDDPSGNILQSGNSPANSPQEIEINNDLQKGSIDANIYKDGKLLAVKKNIAPGQKAKFHFKPILHIGAVTLPVEEGEVLGSAILSDINTEISLLGVISADIVMTGGGTTPYQFKLENVVK